MHVAPPQYSPQIAQDGELKAACYDSMVKGAVSLPSLRAYGASSLYLGPAGRRRSRRIAAHRKAYYGDESDSNMDADCVNGQDDHKHSLAAGVE